MDNQPAETCKKYSTENPGFRHCDVGLGICWGTRQGSDTRHRGQIEERLSHAKTGYRNVPHDLHFAYSTLPDPPVTAGKPSRKLKVGHPPCVNSFCGGC